MNIMVNTILSYPNIYIRQEQGLLQYSTDNASWTDIYELGKLLIVTTQSVGTISYLKRNQ